MLSFLLWWIVTMVVLLNYMYSGKLLQVISALVKKAAQ